MKKSTKKRKQKTAKSKLRKKRKGTSTRSLSSRKRASAKPKKAVLRKEDKSLKAIGKVTHYFPKVKAGVVKITKGTLALGDRISIKGHTTDFKQKVDSMQLDRAPLSKAAKGQEIGLRVKSRVRQHDIVYKLA